MFTEISFQFTYTTSTVLFARAGYESSWPWLFVGWSFYWQGSSFVLDWEIGLKFEGSQWLWMLCSIEVCVEAGTPSDSENDLQASATIEDSLNDVFGYLVECPCFKFFPFVK